MVAANATTSGICDAGTLQVAFRSITREKKAEANAGAAAMNLVLRAARARIWGELVHRLVRL
jgi:hypothetical protein